MNRLPFASCSLVLLLAACGGTAVGVAAPTSAAVPAETPTSKETAPAKPAAPTKAESSRDQAALDPLAVGDSLEAAMIPTVVQTPAKQLRPLSRADLESAMKILQQQASPEAALKSLVARLGKPTWTENDKKRVWIAKDGKNCHRFVFDNDGQADVEAGRGSEWRMLSAMARQNACTGEIRKGDLGGS